MNRQVIIPVLVATLLLGSSKAHSQAGLLVDFMPGSCPNSLNFDGQGVFHVAIVGPVSGTITSATINGVPFLNLPALLDQTSPAGPTPCDPCVAAPADGIVDVILKFDTKAVAATLGNPANGACIPVSIVTNLGTGSDYIRILRKKH